MDDKIANTLDLLPMAQALDTGNAIAVFEEKEPKDASLETAQDGLLKVIETGERAMERIAEIAHSSELSSDFEALTKVMKELREANKDLLEVKKTQVDIENKTGGSVTVDKVVHNNIFTGSSKEALEEIRKLKELSDAGKN